MAGFLGEYKATLDAKGRFLLPSGLKKQMEESSDKRFVISRGLEKHLNLYPWDEWNNVFGRVSNLEDFDPEVRQFRRYFMNGATIIELDSAGRILIPQNLRTHAGLEKDISLVATGKLIEIWDDGKYDKFFEEFPIEKFSEMGKKLMSKKDPGNPNLN
jgi:MraZ protein